MNIYNVASELSDCETQQLCSIMTKSVLRLFTSGKLIENFIFPDNRIEQANLWKVQVQHALTRTKRVRVAIS